MRSTWISRLLEKLGHAVVAANSIRFDGSRSGEGWCLIYWPRVQEMRMNNHNSSTKKADRRSFLGQTVSVVAGAAAFSRGDLLGAAGRSASYQFKHAMCNETFEKWPFADTCKAIRKAGYTGIEVAPFTLSEDPNGISAQKRREYASIIRSEGLKLAGLHWLLLAPKGLHVTTPDNAVRERSWQHVRQLIDFCADLGPDGVMIFGSPQQRGTTGGLSRDAAVKHFVDGLAGIAPHAVERGVKVLVETFPTRQDDVARTMDEAVAIIRQIGSPGIQTMFDTGNAAKEVEPHATLVDRYFDLIRYIHIRGTNGPPYDYKPVLNVLRRRGYTGWISLEAFNVSANDAEKIARETLRYMEEEIAKLN